MRFKPKQLFSQKQSLRSTLILPYMVLITLTVGLIGYFSYTNSLSAVNEVSLKLRSRIAAQIEQHLLDFLNTPYQIDAANLELFHNGQLNPADQAMLQQHFLSQVRLNPNITSIYFGNAQGGIVGSGREGPKGTLYVYETEQFLPGVFKKYATGPSGQPADLLSQTDGFDARTRIWFQKAVSSGQVSYSDIYLSTGQDMALAISAPVYDQQRTLVGVISIDLFMTHLSAFLQGLEISPGGQSFIIQPNGLQVATSVSTPLVEASGENGKLERVLAENSPSPLIRAAAQAIRQTYGDFSRLPLSDQTLTFWLNGEEQHILLRPLHEKTGLDWFVVVIIPQSDFMGQIQANNRFTILVIALALLAASLISVLISTRIIRSVHQLAENARALAAGSWSEPPADTSHIVEIATLTDTFTQMSRRLRQTLDSLLTENQERRQVETSLRVSEERYSRLYVDAQMHAEELTVLNRIGQAVLSSLEFDQMLQTLYEQCQTVLEFGVFYVAIYDEQNHLIRHPFFIDEGQILSIPPRDIRINPGLSGYIIANKQTLYLPDSSDQAAVGRYHLLHTNNRSSLSFVGVPLIVRDRVVGVMSIQSYQVNAYQPDQINLLEIIADQVAAAVEHSRLFAEIQANARFLKLLNEITRSALEANDINTMLQVLANQMGELFNADSCFITRWDEDTQQTYPMAEDKDRSRQYQQSPIVPGEITLTASVLREGHPLAVVDVYHTPYLSPHIAAEHTSKSLLGLPLIAGSQKLGAVLMGFEQTHEFNEQEIALAGLVANQISLAVAKSELVVMDTLTRLYNRRGLIDLGSRELERSQRYGDPLSAILFDIDLFKQVNDQHGHEIGDQVLKAIAKYARQNVRVSDLVGRYGGEEFVILLPETSLEEARQLAERLCLIVSSTPIATTKVELSITISLGVAELSSTILDLDCLINAADEAMYAAKKAGRNQVKVA